MHSLVSVSGLPLEHTTPCIEKRGMSGLRVSVNLVRPPLLLRPIFQAALQGPRGPGPPPGPEAPLSLTITLVAAACTRVGAHGHWSSVARRVARPALGGTLPQPSLGCARPLQLLLTLGRSIQGLQAGGVGGAGAGSTAGNTHPCQTWLGLLLLAAWTRRGVE